MYAVKRGKKDFQVKRARNNRALKNYLHRGAYVEKFLSGWELKGA
jgi:hypothetical protein